MKILYVTTIGITMTFFKELIKQLLDEGHIVDILCNEETACVPSCYREWNCRVFHHTCSRSPFSKSNIQAVKQIKDVVRENKYDIVHCHTPVASIFTRLACRRLRKNGLKVFYTAHGFHFYKGAPLVNWLVYYPIEKLCSYFTDTLITINHEDYEFAQKHMKAKRVEYVPGVGIDVAKFRDTVIDRNLKREELGVPRDAFLLVSVGELNKNKNHEVVIRALAKLNNKNIHYVIAGSGPLKQCLLTLSEKLGVSDQVHLLGQRNDVAEIYKASDVCCFPSIREGLPVSVMEAMASKLPIIANLNRGTKDLLCDAKCGMLVRHNTVEDYSEKIAQILLDDIIREEMGNGAQRISVKYDHAIIVESVKSLYVCSLF